MVMNIQKPVTEDRFRSWCDETRRMVANATICTPRRAKQLSSLPPKDREHLREWKGIDHQAADEIFRGDWDL